MIPATRNWTRDEMMKRVAFFRNLKGSKTGLPDSDLPECERELINVIGFHPLTKEGPSRRWDRRPLDPRRFRFPRASISVSPDASPAEVR
jgi:hypothetical protein